MFDFEKFSVYRKAEEQYCYVLKVLDNQEIDRNIKNQLRRASLSVVLNIAEGAGKYSKRDKKNFYTIAKGSVNECVALIRVLRIEQQIPGDLFRKTYNSLECVAKMLTALINKMKDEKG
jgi:four helix bundle protein